MSAYPDGSGAQAPGPHETHNELIDALHRAIQSHPSPEVKALYGKSLAAFLAHQSKIHAAHQQATQHSVGGGAQTDGQGAPGQQPGQVIQSLSGGGSHSYYGDAPNLPAILAALGGGGMPDQPGFGAAPPPESGLLGAILGQHPLAA